MIKRPIRDKMALSFLSGIFGTLVMYCVGVPLYILKFSKSIYLVYAFELFVTPEVARTTTGYIAGAMTGFLVGAALALGFKLVIEWTGYDWFWLKTAGYGAIMWLLWVGVVRSVLNISKYLFTDVKTNLILLMQSEIYIIATAYFMIKLAGSKEAIQLGDLDKRK